MTLDRSRRGFSPEVSRFAGVGMQFAGSIVLFLFLGWWVDRRLGTLPLFLIVGVFVGAVAGFYSMYRKLVIEPAREERERSARPEVDSDGKEG